MEIPNIHGNTLHGDRPVTNQVQTAGGTQTTSTVYEVFETRTFHADSGKALFLYSADVFHTGGIGSAQFRLKVDGTVTGIDPIADINHENTSEVKRVNINYLIEGLQPGIEHTLEIEWKVNVQTGNIRNRTAIFIEIV